MIRMRIHTHIIAEQEKQEDKDIGISASRKGIDLGQRFKWRNFIATCGRCAWC